MSDNKANIQAILANPNVQSAMEAYHKNVYKYVQDRKTDPRAAEGLKHALEENLVAQVLRAAEAKGLPIAQSSMILPGSVAPDGAAIHIFPESYLRSLDQQVDQAPAEPPAAAGGAASIDLSRDSD